MAKRAPTVASDHTASPQERPLETVTEDRQQHLGADGRWYATVELARANSMHLSEEELDARYGKAK